MSTEEYTAYVEAAWPRLFRTAYALTGDQASAEDLLQTALIKVYLGWRRVRKADSPDAYVRRILVNQATSLWRARRRRPEVLSAEPRDDDAAVGPGFTDDLAVGDELWQSVQALPDRQRAVVVLRYYEDLSERETAEALDVATGTVKSLSNAAMSKLRAHLVPVHEPRNGGDR